MRGNSPRHVRLDFTRYFPCSFSFPLPFSFFRGTRWWRVKEVTGQREQERSPVHTVRTPLNHLFLRFPFFSFSGEVFFCHLLPSFDPHALAADLTPHSLRPFLFLFSEGKETRTKGRPCTHMCVQLTPHHRHVASVRSSPVFLLSFVCDRLSGR